MRVALFPSSFAPAVGGVEELTQKLGECLLAHGDQVEVWTPRDPSTLPPAIEKVGALTVRRFDMPLPPARPALVANAVGRAGRGLWEMWKAHREFRPHVIHVQCFGPNGVYATALSEISRVPLIVTLQGETLMDDHDIYDHSSSLRAGLRLGIRRAAAVTGCSAFTLADAEKRFGLRRGRGKVVFNGVSLEESASRAPDVPFRRYVLALGRVVNKKGFDLLIRAFARIAASFPDVGLVVAGGGPQLDALQSLANELQISSQVLFPGRQDRERVAALMEGADLFVMPSRLEPFGIVVLEAWRSGTPLVATSRGGPPEFLEDGVDGLLVDPLDTESLASAMKLLLEDEALRERLGSAGKQKVRQFTWDAISAQYEDLYRSAIGRGSTPSLDV